jgi:hypothetical protein
LLADIAEEAQHLMAVTDEDGRLLWIEGHPRVRVSAADEMSFVEGALRDRDRARAGPATAQPAQGRRSGGRDGRCRLEPMPGGVVDEPPGRAPLAPR